MLFDLSQNPQPRRWWLLRTAKLSSIVISPFEQRLRAAAQCFCCNDKAARFAFECLHLTSIGARPCSHKLHSLAAAWASHVLAVMHWKMSPSHNAQGGPLGPETSPLAPYATIGLINGEAVVKWISFSSWLKHCAY